MSNILDGMRKEKDGIKTTEKKFCIAGDVLKQLQRGPWLQRQQRREHPRLAIPECVAVVAI
jgi:hypothetical protein